MLARQLCLRQARCAGAGRPVYLARATLPSKLQTRCASTAPGRRIPTTGSRTTVGTATVVNIDSVPTFTNIKPTNAGLTTPQLKNLEREYKNYLQNPYKLAKAVQNRLSKDRYEEALVLTRKASGKDQVVVAWNHLIEYTFKEQRLNAAVKLFNEMKKRQQLPNAATYTTIFRGCAMSEHPKSAVAEAVKIYMAMLTSNRLRPNIIHTNAVLQVCARALDTEAMMSVAETIDDKERKADSVTYATVLHGLRATIDAQAETVDWKKNPSKESVELHRDNISRVIEQARRVWDEVMRKWSSGALVLEEKLVCAMGRILLLGGKAEKMSIFGLLEQTMSIPNLEKKAAAGSESGHLAGKDAVDATDAAASKRESSVPRTKPARCPAPTTKTLALVLMTLQDARRIHLTLGYWRILTEGYKVEADANSWYTLLYSIRKSHSSSQAVKTLRSMPASYITVKAFVVALKACLLDNVNPQVLQNADAVIDHMIETLPRSNLECLQLYVNVATTSHHKFRLERKRGADHAEISKEYAEQVDSALERLWEKGAMSSCRDQLIDLLEKAAGKSKHQPKTRRGVNRSQGPTMDPSTEARLYAAEFIALMRKMIAAWDHIISEELLPEERLKVLRPRRNTANRFVTNYFNALTELGARVDSKAKAEEAAEDGDEEGPPEGGDKRRGEKQRRMLKTGHAPLPKVADENKLLGELLEISEDFKGAMPK